MARSPTDGRAMAIAARIFKLFCKNMKIEQIGVFKKIKGVFGEGLCLAEEHGLMIAFHDDFRTVAAYSFETGERVWMHKFGRYCHIDSIERIGRWVFVEVNDCGSDTYRWLMLDLQSLESVLWHEKGIAPFESSLRRFLIGSKVVFLMSISWDDSVKPRCVCFDSDSGSLAECPELAKRWRGAFGVAPRYAMRYEALVEGDERLVLYRVDSEGLPTEKVIATVQDSNVSFRGCLDDSICVFLQREDRSDIAIARYSLDGKRVAELPFPALTPGVSDDDKAIDAEVVLVNVGGEDRLLVWRRDNPTGCRTVQYLLFDVELKELIWSRSFSAYGAKGASLTAGAILHPDGKDRVNITHLATGAGAEYEMAHYHFSYLDGAALPLSINHRFDCRGIGDHLFWMGNPSRALHYGRVVL